VLFITWYTGPILRVRVRFLSPHPICCTFPTTHRLLTLETSLPHGHIGSSRLSYCWYLMHHSSLRGSHCVDLRGHRDAPPAPPMSCSLHCQVLETRHQVFGFILIGAARSSHRQLRPPAPCCVWIESPTPVHLDRTTGIKSPSSFHLARSVIESARSVQLDCLSRLSSLGSAHSERLGSAQINHLGSAPPVGSVEPILLHRLSYLSQLHLGQ
jgi:hypothetical protein